MVLHEGDPIEVPVEEANGGFGESVVPNPVEPLVLAVVVVGPAVFGLDLEAVLSAEGEESVKASGPPAHAVLYPLGAAPLAP